MESQRISQGDGVATTYGVGSEHLAITLPSFTKHHVKVITGSLSVAYRDAAQSSGDAYTVIEGAVTPASQSFYNLAGVGSFEFTATGATEFVIRSYD